MAACRHHLWQGASSCNSKPLTWAEENTWLRAWHAGDGSCKLWDARTLACLHVLAGESGGATSCYLGADRRRRLP